LIFKVTGSNFGARGYATLCPCYFFKKIRKPDKEKLVMTAIKLLRAIRISSMKLYISVQRNTKKYSITLQNC
jgi:hypothetical protein